MQAFRVLCSPDIHEGHKGVKESGDGDPRGMIANLDRAPPAARIGNRSRSSLHCCEPSLVQFTVLNRMKAIMVAFRFDPVRAVDEEGGVQPGSGV